MQETIKEYLNNRKNDIEYSIKIVNDLKIQSFLKGELLMIENIEKYIEKLEQNNGNKNKI